MNFFGIKRNFKYFLLSEYRPPMLKEFSVQRLQIWIPFQNALLGLFYCTFCAESRRTCDKIITRFSNTVAVVRHGSIAQITCYGPRGLSLYCLCS